MGKNPSKFQNDKNLPVEQVNWNDCQEFSKKLLVKDKKPYHLQTEAEWEYACRAGVPRLPCRSLQPYPLPPISEELHPCQIASGLAWLGMHLGIRHHSKPLVRFHFPVPQLSLANSTFDQLLVSVHVDTGGIGTRRRTRTRTGRTARIRIQRRQRRSRICRPPRKQK